MDNKMVNILLVEDDEVDVRNIKRAFAKNKMKNPVYMAPNGESALDLLRQDKIPSPRVILLDLNMPRMGGIEFLAEIRKDKALKNIQVIVMSTSFQEKDKADAYKHHVAGYIVKSMDNEKFIKSIAALNNFWQVCSYPESN
ncbi:MAG: response regulator [Bacteroidota bacterium]